MDPEKSEAFERLAAEIVKGSAQEISYDLPHPKHEFVQWLPTSSPEVAFHGSVRSDLTELRPIRMSQDTTPFGNQRAVYASSDGLWAMYFAVLNRSSNPSFRGTKNTCVRPAKRLFRNSYYYFSVNPEAHNDLLLNDGWLYFIPISSFTAEAPAFGLIDSAHLASVEPVPCLARLAVSPFDFPFRTLIVSHTRGDSELKVLRRARAAARLNEKQSENLH